MVMLTFFWPLWLQSAKAWTLLTFCPNSGLNSPTPSWIAPLAESFRILLFKRKTAGKYPWCSPYLLQTINPSFSYCLACLCLLAQQPRDKPGFGATEVCCCHEIWPAVLSKFRTQNKSFPLKQAPRGSYRCSCRETAWGRRKVGSS